jgi:molybdenum cofactor cytidylyltransferase
MTAALRAYPELIRSPRHAGARISQLHIGAATLAADLTFDVGHARDSSAEEHSTAARISFVIPAVVLAAGTSSRMGRAKATLPLPNGDTFLSRIVATFLDAGIDDVVVVVGHEAELVVSTFNQSGLPARFVRNPDFARGQFSSILAGLRAIDRPGVAAMLITLVDVPLVSEATVRAVLDQYRRTHAPIVRPTSGSRHGHPVLIDRSLFDELRRANLTAGAKPVVRAHATAAGDIAIADEGAFTDFDTPDDLAKAGI